MIFIKKKKKKKKKYILNTDNDMIPLIETIINNPEMA